MPQSTSVDGIVPSADEAKGTIIEQLAAMTDEQIDAELDAASRMLATSETERFISPEFEQALAALRRLFPGSEGRSPSKNPRHEDGDEPDNG